MNPALIIINALVFCLYVGLASFANVCLLGRDDRNIELARLSLRARDEDFGLRDSRRKRRQMSTAVSSSSASMPNLFATPLPVPDSPASSRSSRNSSFAVSSGTNGDCRMDRATEDDEPHGSSCDLSDVCSNHSLVWSDVRCWFFILVIVSSCMQAVVGLIIVLQSRQQELQLEGRRGTQDLTVSPAILSVYITFTSLLLILVHLVEKEVGHVDLTSTGTSTVSIRSVIIAIGLLVGLLVPCIVVVALNKWDDALEVYSTCVEFVLCACYAVASSMLPRRVLSFGQGLQAVATKIRNVCLAVALCMLLRGVLILPVVQTKMGALGDYALPILEATTTLPVLLSLFLLHQPTK